MVCDTAMNSTRKTICLVTNWYPTKENPYQGLFFKEQAFEVSEKYDFVVLRYTEKIKQIRGFFFELGNEERNTREYTVKVRIPIYVLIADAIHNLIVKKVTHQTIDGVGKYISDSHTNFRKRVFRRLFDNNIKENIDVLYCVDAQTEAAVLKVISDLIGKPYVVGEHAPIPWPGTVLNDVSKSAIEQARVFLAISNDKIRQLKLLNIKLPTVKYIGNMVNESQFVINNSNKDKDHIKTFIIVAAHSYYKNYDMFITVMNRLKGISKIPFKVMIVGYGSNKGYSKNIDIFEKKIKDSRFVDNVELIPEVPHSEIGEVLNRADAFVMTSIQEGQPVSAMEAACCGLPIFSTRCGGVEDYVDDTMGRIYSIDDVEGMAHGLKDYLEERVEFDSDHIRQRIISKFGKDAFIKNFTEAFELAME